VLSVAVTITQAILFDYCRDDGEWNPGNNLGKFFNETLFPLRTAEDRKSPFILTDFPFMQDDAVMPKMAKLEAVQGRNQTVDIGIFLKMQQASTKIG